MTTLRESFEAALLQVMRKRSSVSQRQLGLRVGVGEGIIAEWELGKSTPQLHHILALASALGVPVSALIKRAG
jgi:transcriptional regulator with XRE-family HTH domain